MTVLVLSLSIPSIIATNIQAETYVHGLGPVVLSYVMSFLILAVFWVRHHNMFHYIRNVDTSFIWLNIAFLLTIGFIPFSTELVGRFPEAEISAEISAEIYGANLIATGICVIGLWYYARSRKLLIADNLDEDVLNSINKRLTGGPLIYLGAILISYITGLPEVAIAIYVIALVYYVLASTFGLFSRAGKARKAFDAKSSA